MIDPPPLDIAGIYIICSRLGLPKDREAPDKLHHLLVAMDSGRDAVYAYQGYEHGFGVDWGWHHYAFQRYALSGDAGLPRCGQ